MRISVGGLEKDAESHSLFLGELPGAFLGEVSLPVPGGIVFLQRYGAVAGGVQLGVAPDQLAGSGELS